MTNTDAKIRCLSGPAIEEASKRLAELRDAITNIQKTRLDYFHAVCRSEADALGLLRREQPGRRSALLRWIHYACMELKLCQPGWIVAAFEKDSESKTKMRWKWLEGCGLTDKGIRTLTGQNEPADDQALNTLEIYPDPGKYRPGNSESVHGWSDEIEVRHVWCKKDPNWVGSLCGLVCVQVDKTPYGIAIAPILAPYFYHGLKSIELDSEKPEEFVRYVRSLDSEWMLFVATLKELADQCGNAVIDISQSFNIGSHTGDTERRRRAAQKRRKPGFRKQRERRLGDANGFFRSRTYFDELRLRFSRLATDFEDRHGGEFVNRAFRLSFLVKDKQEPGYRWFLTKRQEEELENSTELSPEQKRRFYERIFMPPDNDDDTVGEGMVGCLIGRGLGPVLFSSPITPEDYERKAAFNSEAWKRMTDCKACEAKLWAKDLFTVEFEIGRSGDFGEISDLSDAFFGWPVDEDSIVAVIQYDNAQRLLSCLPHDMRQACEQGALAISEMKACRDEFEAGVRAGESEVRANLAASFSHAYVKQAAALYYEAGRIASAAVTSGIIETGTLSRSVKAFRSQVQVYQREMEVFSEFSKGNVEFMPDLSADLHLHSPIFAYLFKSLVLAVTVAASSDLLLWLPEDDRGRLVDTCNDLSRKLIDSDAVPTPDFLREHLLKFQNAVGHHFVIELAPRDACLDTVYVLPPCQPSDSKKTTVEHFELLQHVLEKIFFEIVNNALRNWDLASKHTCDLFERTPKRLVIDFPSGARHPIILRSTSFFPVTEKEVNIDEYRSFREKWHLETEPPRPHESGGTGGWGLFGNSLLTRLMRDNATCGRYAVSGDFNGIPTDATSPYCFMWESRLYLPPGFLRIAPKKATQT